MNVKLRIGGKSNNGFGLAVAAFALGLPATSLAEPLVTAQIVRSEGEVRVIAPSGSAQRLSLNLELPDQGAIQTGQESMADLEFSNAAEMRLGSNSLLTFMDGIEEMRLHSGVLLFKMPGKVMPMKISAGWIDVTLSGEAAAMVEFSGASFRVIALESKVRLQTNPKEKSRLQGRLALEQGEVVTFFPEDEEMPEPMGVNLEMLIKNTELAWDFG